MSKVKGQRSRSPRTKTHCALPSPTAATEWNAFAANNVMQQQTGPFRRCRVVTGLHRQRGRSLIYVRRPAYGLCLVEHLYALVFSFFCLWMKYLGNWSMDLCQIHRKDVFGPSLGRVWMSRWKIKSPGAKTRCALPSPQAATECNALAANDAAQQQTGPFHGCLGVISAASMQFMFDKTSLDLVQFYSNNATNFYHLTYIGSRKCRYYHNLTKKVMWGKQTVLRACSTSWWKKAAGIDVV